LKHYLRTSAEIPGVESSIATLPPLVAAVQAELVGFGWGILASFLGIA